DWLAPGGQLRPLAERIASYDFIDRRSLERSLAAPNWFLSSLLCYDLWHKLFIERSLPRPEIGKAAGPVEAPFVGATPSAPPSGGHGPADGIETFCPGGTARMPLYQRLVRDVLMPVALWRRGELGQLRYEREFEGTQFLPPEELRRLQTERVRALLAHAYE